MRPHESLRHIAGAPRAAAKHLYRRLVGERPDDPVQAWPGTELEGQPVLRMLHVGDCGVRRMEGAHDLLAPLGYPLTTARELFRHGVGVDFSHYFCVSFEDLPHIEKLRSHMRLGGDPDIVLVQIGSAYTRKVILPDRRRVHQLRDELARRTGRFVFTFYRGLRPCLRLFGRHSASYRGTHRLEQFVDALQCEWPTVKVVLVVPFRRSPGYRSGEPVAARIESDLHAFVEIPKVFVFDANDVLGREPGLRCVTGYNLNGHASQLVGIKLAKLIRERLQGVPAGATREPAHKIIARGGDAGTIPGRYGHDPRAEAQAEPSIAPRGRPAC